MDEYYYIDNPFYDPHTGKSYPTPLSDMRIADKYYVDRVSIGCPELVKGLKAIDVIREALYGGANPWDGIVSRNLYFMDGIIISKDQRSITVCISDRLNWIGRELPGGDIPEDRAIKFTRDMIDDLPAEDFISILRNRYQKLLERAE